MLSKPGLLSPVALAFCAAKKSSWPWCHPKKKAGNNFNKAPKERRGHRLGNESSPWSWQENSGIGMDQGASWHLTDLDSLTTLPETAANPSCVAYSTMFILAWSNQCSPGHPAQRWKECFPQLMDGLHCWLASWHWRWGTQKLQRRKISRNMRKT